MTARYLADEDGAPDGFGLHLPAELVAFLAKASTTTPTSRLDQVACAAVRIVDVVAKPGEGAWPGHPAENDSREINIGLIVI
jgi:hypothetical protein